MSQKVASRQVWRDLQGVGFFLLSLVLCLGAGCRPPEREERAEFLKSSEERVVRLFIWSDYINPEIVSRFEAETGIRVEVIPFDTQEELVGRVWSSHGQYDVVVAEDALVALFQHTKQLRPWDVAKIPNLTNINPAFLHRPVDPGQSFTVPYHWGTVLLAYRRDKVGELRPTWSVLWDPRYAGQIWMLRDVFDLITVAAIYAGLNLNGADTNVLAEIGRLVSQQSEGVARYADTLSIAEGLVSGDCAIGVLYSGDAARAALRNTNIVYVIPSEGAPIWVDNLCLLRNAEHPDAAHTFVNFLLDGPVAAANANYVRFATPNEAARLDLDRTMLQDLQLYPSAEVLARCVFRENPDPTMLQLEGMLRAELSRGPAWSNGSLMGAEMERGNR